ncbi:hypothetical protein PcaKH15_16290 [Parageobacillus caldoxylosilyticus]|nr:hypothetical protein PcaKH15_16290 [Parageobacillus caldoxylosilyticus]
MASDRTKATIAKVTWMGSVVKSKVDKVIVSKLRSENILVTDAWRAYKTYAKEKGLQHYRIKSDDGTHVIKGIYHIQNVNDFHSRLKQWMDRFKGMASKHLDNYWLGSYSWIVVITRTPNRILKICCYLLSRLK